MRGKLRDALLLCAAALAVTASILLPPALSRLADRRLVDGEVHSVQAETLDISLVYQLSTAERLALLARSGGEDVLLFTGGQPAQDELTAGQAAALCQEELDRLFQLGVLPSPFQIADATAAYWVLCDPDDRQRSVSLWNLSMSVTMPVSEKGLYAYSLSCTLTMDAQTGLIYSLSLALPMEQSFSLEEAAEAWGTYLELGAPVIQGTAHDPEQMTLLSAAYQTEGGTIAYYFNQNWYMEPYNLFSISPYSAERDPNLVEYGM